LNIPDILAGVGRGGGEGDIIIVLEGQRISSSKLLICKPHRFLLGDLINKHS
jgi:hypothetical protein